MNIFKTLYPLRSVFSLSIFILAGITLLETQTVFAAPANSGGAPSLGEPTITPRPCDSPKPELVPLCTCSGMQSDEDRAACMKCVRDNPTDYRECVIAELCDPLGSSTEDPAVDCEANSQCCKDKICSIQCSRESTLSRPECLSACKQGHLVRY